MNTLVIAGISYPVDLATAGVVSENRQHTGVNSFSIITNEDKDNWVTTINQDDLVGQYATQAQALGALVGCFIHAGADQGGLEYMIDQLAQNGSGHIDPDTNVMSQVLNRTDVEITVERLAKGGSNTLALGFQQSTTQTFTSITPVAAISAAEGGNQTSSYAFSQINENSYYRGVLFDVITNNILATTTTDVKDTVAPTGLSLKIGSETDENAVPGIGWDGSSYSGSAKAWPIWATEDWPSGVTPQYGYSWTYTFSGGSPIPIGGNTQVLDFSLLPGTFSSTVVINATVTAVVGPWVVGPVSAPAQTLTVGDSAPVADIKLFNNMTGSGNTATPVGPEVTEPGQPNSSATYYAFAYDASGALITGRDVTWSNTIPAHAPLTVSSLGWDGELLLPGSIPNDGDDPNYNYTNTTPISVTRPGYTNAGVATNQTISTELTTTVQKVYPNNSEKDTANVGGTQVQSRQALPITTFATDTLTGSIANMDGTGNSYTMDITNNSSAPPQGVICNWTTPVVDYVHTDTLTVDLFASHASASSGNMGIACVRFTVTDSSGDTSVIVTTPTTATSSVTDIKYPVYRLNHDISGDADGEAYTIKAEVFPVWGPKFTTKSSPDGLKEFKRITNPNQVFDCLRWRDTGGGAIPQMWVDPSGSDLNPGTQASPKATMIAALGQLNSNTSAFQGIVHVVGEHNTWNWNMTGGWSSNANLTLPLKVLGDGTAKFTGGATSANNTAVISNPWTIVENIELDLSTTTGTHTNSNGGGGYYWMWGPSTPTSLDNVGRIYKKLTYKDAPSGSNTFSRVYDNASFYECRDNNPATGAVRSIAFNRTGLSSLPSVYKRGGHIVGCFSTATDIGCSSAIGNIFHKTQLTIGGGEEGTNGGLTWTGTPFERPAGNIIAAYNSSQAVGDVLVFAVLEGPITDVAVIGNYLEKQSATASQQLVYIGADGDTGTWDNVLFWNNTGYGARMNYNYNDTIYSLRQTWSIHNNLMQEMYIKSDANFAGGNAARFGNWNSMHSVDARANAIYRYSGAFAQYYTNDYFTDATNTTGICTETTGSNTSSRSLGDPAVTAAANYTTITNWTASDMLPILGDNTDGQNLGAGALPTAPVSASTDDYDTAATDGTLFFGYGNNYNFSSYLQDGVSGASLYTLLTSGNYFDGIRTRTKTSTVGGKSVNGVQVLSDPSGNTNYAPYIAMWWGRQGSSLIRDWYVGKYESTASDGGFYSFVEARNGATAFPANNALQDPLVIYRYPTQPANVSGWRNYDGPTSAPTGPLQTVTWTMTSSTAATVSSTGTKEVILPTRTSGLGIPGASGTGLTGPRLWNGAEAVQYGAQSGSNKYTFASNADCNTFWQNFAVRMRQNSGSGFGPWYRITTDLDESVMYTSAQKDYANSGAGMGGEWGFSAETQAAGLVVEFEVYTNGNMPFVIEGSGRYEDLDLAATGTATAVTFDNPPGNMFISPQTNQLRQGAAGTEVLRIWNGQYGSVDPYITNNCSWNGSNRCTFPSNADSTAWEHTYKWQFSVDGLTNWATIPFQSIAQPEYQKTSQVLSTAVPGWSDPGDIYYRTFLR